MLVSWPHPVLPENPPASSLALGPALTPDPWDLPMPSGPWGVPFPLTPGTSSYFLPPWGLLQPPAPCPLRPFSGPPLVLG